jgi:hypothetical protein
MRRSLGAARANEAFLVCRLHLEEAKAASLNPIVVGILVYEVTRADGARGSPEPGTKVARWHTSDLVIPAALRGAGFTRRFLEGISDHFEKNGFREMHVLLGDRSPAAGGDRRPLLRSPADRAALLQRIALYKSRGFAYDVRAAIAEREASGSRVASYDTLVKTFPAAVNAIDQRQSA